MAVNSPIVTDPSGFGYGAIPQILRMAQEQLHAQAQAGQQQQQRMSAEPDPRAYGIFSPAYAQNLNAPTDSASERFLNRTALMLNADAERDAYADALEAAGNTAIRQATIQAASPVEVARINNEREAILRGGGQTVIDDDGIARVQYDPALTMRDNQLGANQVLSETTKNNLGAVRDAYESGYDIIPEVVSGYLTPPGQETPTPVGRLFDTGLNPDDEVAMRELPIKEMQAQAAMTQAGAAQTRAERGTDDLQETVIVDPNTGVVLRREYRGPVGSVGGGGGGGGAPSATTAPQSSEMQARIINNANSRGFTTRMVGDSVEVTLPDGQKRYFNQSGQRVQAPSSGGAIEQ